MSQFFKNFKALPPGVYTDPDITVNLATAEIVSNAVYSEGNALQGTNTVNSNARMEFSVDSFRHNNNVAVEIEIARGIGTSQETHVDLFSDSSLGFNSRASTDLTAYDFYLLTYLRIFRYVSGASSQLGTIFFSPALADGDILRYEIAPSGANLVIKVYRNGLLEATVTDTSPLSIPPGGGWCVFGNRTNADGAIYRFAGADGGQPIPTSDPFVNVSGSSEQDSQLTGTLGISVPAEISGIVSTDSVLSGTLTVAVPVAGAMVTDSDLSATIGTSIRFSGASNQGSFLELDPGLSFKTIGVLEQDSELVGTLRDAMAFRGLSETDSQFNAVFLSFADEFEGLVESVSNLSATLTVVNRLAGEIETRSELVGQLKKALRLISFPVETQSFLQADLRIVGEFSRGYLTVSDIFLHNSHYESVVLTRVSASEISLKPAVQVDAIKLQPE